jgi:hypothetical protein
VLEISRGTIRTRLGTAGAPDLVLAGEPRLILALFAGKLTAIQAAELGLQFSGDQSLLDRVLAPPTAYPVS